MRQQLTANDYSSGALIQIDVSGERVQGVRVLSDRADAAYPWVCPGFIDVQVNGFGGFDLNAADADRHTVAGMIHALVEHGVTLCMPTVITASFEQMAGSLEAIRQACEADPVVNGSIAGIHLEGPYLSPEQGFRGAHPADQMRESNWEELLAWQRISGGKIRMVTLAPELPGSIPFIRSLTAHGIIASIGHSNASAADIRAAMDAGLRMGTHLGNGIRASLDRHAACVWDVLAADDLYAGFIADGHHLPASIIHVIVGMKRSKAVLVSDAVHLAGMPPGAFTTHIGGEVELLPSGRLQLAGNPQLLAGSAMSMADGVRHLLRLYPGRLRQVIDTATSNPAELLRLRDRGRIEAGGVADFVVFEMHGPDGEFAIREVWRQGRLV